MFRNELQRIFRPQNTKNIATGYVPHSKKYVVDPHPLEQEKSVSYMAPSEDDKQRMIKKIAKKQIDYYNNELEKYKRKYFESREGLINERVLADLRDENIFIPGNWDEVVGDLKPVLTTPQLNHLRDTVGADAFEHLQSIKETSDKGKLLRVQRKQFMKLLARLDISKNIKGQAQATFINDFHRWLLGIGSENDHRKTPWYRTPIHHKDVKDYISSFVSMRHEFLKALALLQYRKPRNLDECYLYFKYIVRGNLYDLNTESFLADWDKFHPLMDFGRWEAKHVQADVNQREGDLEEKKSGKMESSAEWKRKVLERTTMKPTFEGTEFTNSRINNVLSGLVERSIEEGESSATQTQDFYHYYERYPDELEVLEILQRPEQEEEQQEEQQQEEEVLSEEDQGELFEEIGIRPQPQRQTIEGREMPQREQAGEREERLIPRRKKKKEGRTQRIIEEGEPAHAPIEVKRPKQSMEKLFKKYIDDFREDIRNQRENRESAVSKYEQLYRSTTKDLLLLRQNIKDDTQFLQELEKYRNRPEVEVIEAQYRRYLDGFFNARKGEIKNELKKYTTDDLKRIRREMDSSYKKREDEYKAKRNIIRNRSSGGISEDDLDELVRTELISDYYTKRVDTVKSVVDEIIRERSKGKERMETTEERKEKGKEKEKEREREREREPLLEKPPTRKKKERSELATVEMKSGDGTEESRKSEAEKLHESATKIFEKLGKLYKRKGETRKYAMISGLAQKMKELHRRNVLITHSQKTDLELVDDYKDTVEELRQNDVGIEKEKFRFRKMLEGRKEALEELLMRRNIDPGQALTLPRMTTSLPVEQPETDEERLRKMEEEEQKYREEERQRKLEEEERQRKIDEEIKKQEEELQRKRAEEDRQLNELLKSIDRRSAELERTTAEGQVRAQKDIMSLEQFEQMLRTPVRTAQDIQKPAEPTGETATTTTTTTTAGITTTPTVVTTPVPATTPAVTPVPSATTIPIQFVSPVSTTTPTQTTMTPSPGQILRESQQHVARLSQEAEKLREAQEREERLAELEENLIAELQQKRRKEKRKRISRAKSTEREVPEVSKERIDRRLGKSGIIFGVGEQPEYRTSIEELKKFNDDLRELSELKERREREKKERAGQQVRETLKKAEEESAKAREEAERKAIEDERNKKHMENLERIAQLEKQREESERRKEQLKEKRRESIEKMEKVRESLETMKKQHQELEESRVEIGKEIEKKTEELKQLEEKTKKIEENERKELEKNVETYRKRQETAKQTINELKESLALTDEDKKSLADFRLKKRTDEDYEKVVDILAQHDHIVYRLHELRNQIEQKINEILALRNKVKTDRAKNIYLQWMRSFQNLQEEIKEAERDYTRAVSGTRLKINENKTWQQRLSMKKNILKAEYEDKKSEASKTKRTETTSTTTTTTTTTTAAAKPGPKRIAKQTVKPAAKQTAKPATKPQSPQQTKQK